MDITLMYFDGCPNWTVTEERLKQIAAERGDLKLSVQRVESPEDAERLGFHGSPTVLIDGKDAFGDDTTPVAFACRLYLTPDGPAGSPTSLQLREAIAAS